MPTYGLIEIWRPRPEWYALPKAQKQRFNERAREMLGALMEKGAKVTGIFKCRASSQAGWDMMGYWEMPTFELVTELAERLEKLGWNRYFDQINLVGYATDPDTYMKSLLEDTEV